MVEDLNIDGGMPPTFRNHRGGARQEPTCPAVEASSSLVNVRNTGPEPLKFSSHPLPAAVPVTGNGELVLPHGIAVFARPSQPPSFSRCDDRLNPPNTSSIRYTERLAEAGVEPSVGSVGDSYDNALAETINGLYKAEVIHRRGPWRSFEAVEFATLEWVDWFNNRRLLEPIGNIPPAEAEERYYAMLKQPAMAA